jgi:hypothetical protein
VAVGAVVAVGVGVAVGVPVGVAVGVGGGKIALIVTRSWYAPFSM